MSRTGAIDAPVVMTVRQAEEKDLLAAAEIYANNDAEIDRRMHPLSGLPELDAATRIDGALADLQLLHGEDPRQVWVAESSWGTIGVSAAAYRERHAHILYLFVAPHAQERGIGRALLHRLQDAGTAAGCTVWTLQASDDPRAMTRYFRLGLRPQAPNVMWSANDAAFPNPGFSNQLEALPLRIDDDAAIATVGDIDKAVRGIRRRPDIERWLRDGAWGFLLIDRANGKPAGYFLCSIDRGEGRIGPVAAMDETRFGDVLRLAFVAAAARNESGRKWNVAVPGENHAAIEPLLATRFRPTYLVPFFASQPIGRFDRYVFHDLDLL